MTDATMTGGALNRALLARQLRLERTLTTKTRKRQLLRGEGSNLQASGSKVTSGLSPETATGGLSCSFTTRATVQKAR